MYSAQQQNNFDDYVDRHHSGSYKWDSSSDSDMLPMFVADMDFKVAPPIIEALEQRVRHGVFGYTVIGPEYYRAITDWFLRRHHWPIEKDWILYTSGVVPAISCIIKAFTHPGDGVITQTPAYNCFFSSIRNNGCTLIPNPLIPIGDTYRIDFDDLEQKASDSRNKMLLLCNPHNPSGRVWTQEELEQVAEICYRHHVLIVSDEIHCELVMPGYHFTPFGTLAPKFQSNVIVCNSPSKSFNTAGLQIANIITPRADFRVQIERAINDNEVCDVNPFGITALIAAYNRCEDWLNDLILYIAANYHYLQQFISDQLPQISVNRLEGTYLPCLDVSKLPQTSQELCDKLKQEQHLWLNPAEMYEGGEHFIRINIACPRQTLQEGLNRLYKGLKP